MGALFMAAFGLGLAFCAPPGAITAEALRRGLARGFRPAFLLEIGSLIGDATWAVLALTGAAFLVQSRVLQVVLSAAGVYFLLRLAWGHRFVTPGFFRAVNLTCGLALALFAARLAWQMLGLVAG